MTTLPHIHNTHESRVSHSLIAAGSVNMDQVSEQLL
jgi:hypothetical protein